MTQRTDSNREYSFPQKVWITGGIWAFILILLLLLKATFSVLLLVLAGVLIAVFFHSFSDYIHRRTGWKGGLCLAISVIGSLLLLVLLFWLIGAKVQSQIQELGDTLPITVQKAKDQLNQSPLGQKMVQKVSSQKTQKKAQALAQTFFKSTFGVLGDFYVVLFIGIFFTVSPRTYKDGIVKLVPPAGKQKAAHVLTSLGENLKKWLKGKIFAMFVVFVLTSIGLVIIGVPMWTALALIAGILNFIPNFGPLIALLPAVLVAFMQGPSTAFWVIALYMFVQVTESNFITPWCRKN
jgi:predicted PurR-regulated permease PerM